MANPQNIINRTREEAVEKGRKGGLASAKTRQRKKLFKELILAVKEEDMSGVVLAMVQQAKKGDVSAATWLANYSGQKMAETIKIDLNAKYSSMTDDELIAEIARMNSELEEQGDLV